jgi:hypothetical protein
MRTILFILLSAAILLVTTLRSSADTRNIEMRLTISKSQNESYIIIGSQIDPNAGYSANTKKVTDTNISIPIIIYRGSTLKRTVYVWLRDSLGKIISSKSKITVPDRFSYYNLSADLAILECPNPPVIVVAEGLGINTTGSLAINSVCTPENNTGAKTGMFSWSVLEKEEYIESNNSFRTRVLINNPTGQNLTADAWSYVYRSSKCYSGDREGNRKTINIPEFSNITFDLNNTVNAKPGDYSLKIRLLRSDRKSEEEITMPIVVVGEANEKKDIIPNEDMVGGKKDTMKDAKSSTAQKNVINTDQNRANSASASGKRTLLSSFSVANVSEEPVYLSTTAKAGKLAVYFLIAALTILLIILIFRKL